MISRPLMSTSNASGRCGSTAIGTSIPATTQRSSFDARIGTSAVRMSSAGLARPYHRFNRNAVCRPMQPCTHAASSTIQSYDGKKGTYWWGNVELRLTAPGILAPEEMVRFIPLGQVSVDGGTDGMGIVEDEIVFAPAPPGYSAPVT